MDLKKYIVLFVGLFFVNFVAFSSAGSGAASGSIEYRNILYTKVPTEAEKARWEKDLSYVSTEGLRDTLSEPFLNPTVEEIIYTILEQRKNLDESSDSEIDSDEDSDNDENVDTEKREKRKKRRDKEIIQRFMRLSEDSPEDVDLHQFRIDLSELSTKDLSSLLYGSTNIMAREVITDILAGRKEEIRELADNDPVKGNIYATYYTMSDEDRDYYDKVFPDKDFALLDLLPDKLLKNLASQHGPKSNDGPLPFSLKAQEILDERASQQSLEGSEFDE